MTRSLLLPLVLVAATSCLTPPAERPGASTHPPPLPPPTNVTRPDRPAYLPQPTFTGPGCNIAEALPHRCSVCVRDHCCDPPVAYSRPLATWIDCRKHCRAPIYAQSLNLSDEDREVITQTCLAQCSDDHPDPGGVAARLEDCMITTCNGECISDPMD